MFEEITQTHAAMELSEQELDVVAGGGYPQSAFAKQNTDYSLNQLEFLKATESSGKGSKTVDYVSASALDTAAQDVLDIVNK